MTEHAERLNQLLDELGPSTEEVVLIEQVAPDAWLLAMGEGDACGRGQQGGKGEGDDDGRDAAAEALPAADAVEGGEEFHGGGTGDFRAVPGGGGDTIRRRRAGR